MEINDGLLDRVAQEAASSPRLRMNYNLHESLDAKAQRLINVLLPGTVIPIHRHRDTAETYIVLRGKLIVSFFNDMGGCSRRFVLDPQIGNYGLQIPKGQWHSVEVAEPAALFEVKDGPYSPIAPEDTMD